MIKFRSLMIFLTVLFLSGCTFFSYSPVVVSSMLGLGEKDLGTESPYKKFINKRIKLIPHDDERWQLKKFKTGRYHIERKSELIGKIVVCDLDNGVVVLDRVFFDSSNVNIFFSATVTCNGKTYSAPLNRWSNSLEKSIEFVE